jgi:NADPH-dependent glutamate synthase beta subunit-like oxidoreductase/coenzyme F420-reducing hydrogenase delta subunit/Pyruvate/2-oxoacid:ferredoxin oxidoreductase delta subunit
MNGTCLVLGGTLEGIRVALDLAEAGKAVYLVEEAATIGADLVTSGKGADKNLSRQEVVPALLKAITHPRIEVLTGSRVAGVKGSRGDFRVRISRSPRYIDDEKCRGCGVCIEACPVTLDRSYGTDREGRKAVDFTTPFDVPFVPSIIKERRAPCVETCPAHINIQGYVALVSAGKFKEAYELIRETIPFPSVCGRVCFHPCESECNRGQVDEPIAINAIKRFVSDYVYREGLLEPPVPLEPEGPEVAVVGSGPAGLTAAHDLLQRGYRATVFEALPETGGMLRVGIVDYRLPRDVLDREIDYMETLGVKVRTGCRIGEDLTIDDLFSEGYSAVFLSTGTHGARRLGIEGERLKGVVDGITFLREVNMRGRYKLGKDVIVIGGGNVALDCARTARRLGARTVKVVCLESRKEMPSHSWEIEEALEEGIILMPSLGPKRILGKGGRVTGLETLKVRHVFDEEGRFNPAFYDDTESLVEADSIISAIGQVAEATFLQGAGGVEVDDRGRLKIDRKTMMTSRPGLFAGGDLITGPASVIEAIASGKRAAEAIDHFIRKDGSEIEEWTPGRGEREEPFVVPRGIKKSRRARPARLDPADRLRGFGEIEETITAEMAMKEAARCLNCGSCSECMECLRACQVLSAVDHAQEVEDITIRADQIVVAVDPASSDRSAEEKGKASLFSLLGIETDEHGIPATPRWWEGSLESSPEGIYTPGVGKGPEDHLGRVICADAVASELASESVVTGPSPEECEVRAHTPARSRPVRIGAFVCRCGGGISDYLDVDTVAGRLEGLDSIVLAETIDYACSSEGVGEIRSRIHEESLDSIVLAACSCCSLEQVCSNCSQQRLRQKNEIFNSLGLDRDRVELVNIREHCAWLYVGNGEAATAKAFQIARAGLEELRGHKVGRRVGTREVGRRVAVIGDDAVAVACAGRLASLGLDPIVLWTGHGKMDRPRYWQLPAGSVIEGAELIGIDGGIGDYSIRFRSTATEEGRVSADFVALASDKASVMGNARKEDLSSPMEPFRDRRRGVFRVHVGVSDGDESWKLMLGNALAMRVFVERGSGFLQETGWAPSVDAFWCRGCGTCVEVCPFDACKLVEREGTIKVSVVDPLMCRGCELCVLHCPTGAMRSAYFDGGNVDRMLSALLTDTGPGDDGAAKVMIFACHWCHYGGVDIKARGDVTYPPGVKVLRLTCTGRMGPDLILRAFQFGADGVMVMGCHDGECHYVEGNRGYLEREEVVLGLMRSMGISLSRYRTLWTRPEEQAEFIRDVEDFVKGLGGRSS